MPNLCFCPMALDFLANSFNSVEETPPWKWGNVLNIFGHRMNFLMTFCWTDISLGPFSLCCAPPMTLYSSVSGWWCTSVEGTWGWESGARTLIGAVSAKWLGKFSFLDLSSLPIGRIGWSTSVTLRCWSGNALNRIWKWNSEKHHQMISVRLWR